MNAPAPGSSGVGRARAFSFRLTVWANGRGELVDFHLYAGFAPISYMVDLHLYASTYMLVGGFMLHNTFANPLHEL